MAFTLTGIGTVYGEQGRWTEGEAALRRALAIFDRAAPGHPARQDVVDALAELRRRRVAAATGARPAATATVAPSPG